MIAIDTNVLLRYLLEDDPTQAQRAAELIQGEDKVLITDVVLAEAIWTLKGKRYNLNKAAIAEVIGALFAEPAICFEDSQVVWRALDDFINSAGVKSGGKKRYADFQDALIANKARRWMEQRQQPVDGIYSFDVAALQIPGVKLP